jgi:protein TonB
VSRHAAAAASAQDAPGLAVSATAAAAFPAREDGPVVISSPRFRLPPAPPSYPPRARDLGQEGEVLLQARLDADGTPLEVIVKRSSGFDLLDRAAVAAVRHWAFEPGRRGGMPVAAVVQVPVRFALR